MRDNNNVVGLAVVVVVRGVVVDVRGVVGVILVLRCHQIDGVVGRACVEVHCAVLFVLVLLGVGVVGLGAGKVQQRPKAAGGHANKLKVRPESEEKRRRHPDRVDLFAVAVDKRHVEVKPTRVLDHQLVRGHGRVILLETQTPKLLGLFFNKMDRMKLPYS